MAAGRAFPPTEPNQPCTPHHSVLALRSTAKGPKPAGHRRPRWALPLAAGWDSNEFACSLGLNPPLVPRRYGSAALVSA